MIEGQRETSDTDVETVGFMWQKGEVSETQRYPSPGRERKVNDCQNARKPGSGARDGYPPSWVPFVDGVVSPSLVIQMNALGVKQIGHLANVVVEMPSRNDK